MTSPLPISAFVRTALEAAPAGQPLYRSIAGALSDAVKSGIVGPEDRLPSERSLAAHLGVSRVTVRRALDDFEAEGALRRRQGARSSIAPRVQKTLSSILGFSEELRARGQEPGQKWLLRQSALPSPAETMALGISPSVPVSRLVRIRLADGLPIAIESAALPARFLPDPGLVGESLYETLRALGVAPARGIQRIRAGVMTRAEAEALKGEAGMPLLIVERRCFLADGQAVEFTETRYHGERYDFIADLDGGRRAPD